jgi:hypothetical protein
MTNEEKLKLLLKVLKEYAEVKHCYDVYGDDYTPSAGSYDDAFEDGCAYGEITFARTMLNLNLGKCCLEIPQRNIVFLVRNGWVAHSKS